MNPKVAKEPVPPQLELIAQEILVPLISVFHQRVEDLCIQNIVEIDAEKSLLLMSKCIYYAVSINVLGDDTCVLLQVGSKISDYTDKQVSLPSIATFHKCYQNLSFYNKNPNNVAEKSLVIIYKCMHFHVRTNTADDDLCALVPDEHNKLVIST